MFIHSHEALPVATLCIFKRQHVNAAMQLPLQVGRVDGDYLKMLEKSLQKLL